jgi:TolA-binding protein
MFRLIRLCLVMLALAAAAGCTAFQPKQPEVAVNDYAEAQSKMTSGDYQGAATQLQDFVDANPTSEFRTDAWLMLGDARMKLQDYPGAQRAYESAQQGARTKAINARAKEGLGNAMSAQKRYGEAAKAYEAALSVSKNDIDAPATLLYLGKCYIRSGNWTYGRDRLKRLTRDYPTGSQAPEAHDILAMPSDTFSVQVGAFSTEVTANGMIDALKKNGFTGGRIVRRSYSSAPYAVRVGSYVSYDTAVREAEKLKSVSPTCFVVP